jgi:redox-regulated HSP33 family molecular chaperone
MGLEEMRSLFAEVGEARVTCEFCGTHYHVPGPEMLALIRDHDDGT